MMKTHQHATGPLFLLLSTTNQAIAIPLLSTWQVDVIQGMIVATKAQRKDHDHLECHHCGIECAMKSIRPRQPMDLRMYPWDQAGGQGCCMSHLQGCMVSAHLPNDPMDPHCCCWVSQKLLGLSPRSMPSTEVEISAQQALLPMSCPRFLQ